ncbi:MAG: AraC family transcriptional regulator [Desulfoprunum sp.]|nr:AraC family transcriptional regulator [Desulfoprunum sp.]
MTNEVFFKDQRLPFVECRYSNSSLRTFKAHMHRTFSVGAVDRGRVEYSVGGRTAILSIGALALINPEALHSCNAIDREGRSYYMMYLDVDWCLEVQKALWNVDAFVPVEEIRLDDTLVYNQYCAVAERLMDRNVHLLEKEHLLVELVWEIFGRVCRPQSKQAGSPQNIQDLKSLLGGNLRDDLTLETLARQWGANPYTLLRQFKANIGITPHAYRMNCRVEQARQYLQQGMDIGEAALECGFFDQSHLHRHFKAMTTVTPQEYRVNFIQ